MATAACQSCLTSKGKFLFLPVIQHVYKFFRFEAESPPKAPLPWLPLGCQLSIWIRGGMTAKDLGFTKCFMSAPMSRKSINLFSRSPLSLSTCVHRTGVLLSYWELCFVEDNRKQKMIITRNLRFPILSCTVNSCTKICSKWMQLWRQCWHHRALICPWL